MNPAWKVRFEEKFIRDELNKCWEWIGCIDKRGYGRISINIKNEQSHRISYKLYVGDPTGFYVCHKCDNRKCVNPDHLFLGTATENSLDMAYKGRGLKKISQLQRSVIIEALKLRYPVPEIANYFKLSTTTVYHIEKIFIRTTKQRRVKKLCPIQTKVIKEAAMMGFNQSIIAKYFNVDRAMVSYIKRKSA